jgi:hypothetical protein
MARRGSWRRILGFTLMAVLGAASLGHAQLFRPFSDRSQTMLEGNWQSCREADGQYAERVYDGRWQGVEPFELHMGPYHEFALFRGIQEDHRDHGSANNLLNPHKLDIVANKARHAWDVNGLHLEVVLAGGSREECESWFVTLKRGADSSH